MAADWNIQPRASHCAACGRAFGPGDTGHSVLTRADDTLCRRDFCSECFAKEPVPEEPMVSSWAFTVPKRTKNVVREEPLRRETAEELLRRLLERNRPSDAGAVYVLAVLMERGRQFVERSTEIDADGQRIRLYEQRGTGDIFPIPDPNLSTADLPAVQQRVIDLLEGRDAPELPDTSRLPQRNIVLRRCPRFRFSRVVRLRTYSVRRQ